MELKKELEAAASWFSILVAASYAFTLGYIDILKIPVNPSPMESFLFYFRAMLLSEHHCILAFNIFAPLLLIVIFIKSCRCFANCEMFKDKYLKHVKDIITLILAIVLIWFWCACAFKNGQQSLSTPSAASFFPEAYREATKNAKPLRLAWITEKKIFWLDCNVMQPQLIGIENDKEFYIRRLGSNSLNIICKS